MGTSTEERVKMLQLMGQCIIDHAEELIPMEFSDLTGDDIRIHLRRLRWFPIKKEACECE